MNIVMSFVGAFFNRSRARAVLNYIQELVSFFRENAVLGRWKVGPV